MGDMAEDFNAMRAESQVRRASNREQSADILKRGGIEFESKNMAAHLIVRHAGETVDFWPGTGKWIRRDKNKRPSQGRGVFNLIKALGA